MNENRQKVWLGVVVGICVIAGVYFIGELAGRPVQIDGGCREIMGTFARIVVVANNTRQARRCIEAGFDEMRRVDSAMSDYKADSEISKVNREAFADPVKVSDELFAILQKSVEFSRLSDGAFDITVGPLVDLWRRAGEANLIPDEGAIASARARVGYEKLILDANERTVRFAVDGMRLDLGGIGKGYSVDKAVEAMKNKGAIAGMVDSGGNIRCFGKPLGKDAWVVGVQDPKAAGSDTEATFEGLIPGEYLLVLRLKDAAVATSGDYRRFVTIGGKKVSHIIDTNTATGTSKLSSDTIIAPAALEADALSTAVNVLGADKGLALIESLSASPHSGGRDLAKGGPSVECILITTSPDYRIVKSSGADAYIQ